jgi:uncharacterized RDD family membrane protein YckC
MTDAAGPAPIPPEERESATMLPAEFSTADSPPEGYYHPDPGEPGGQRAQWGERVLAYLIDIALISIPVALGQMVLVLGGQRPGVGAGGAGIVAALAALVSLGVWAWNRGVRQGRTGRSVGKSTVGLVLLAESDGQPVGTGRALLRDVAHILDALPCYLGFLWPLWDAKRQTWADKIVKTTVLTT